MEHTPEQCEVIGDFRARLVAGCSAEEFAGMRCPVCGGRLELDVHSRGRMFFVRCVADTTHVAFHAVNPDASAWWAAHRSSGWISEA